MVCEWVQQLAVIKCDWMLGGCWSETWECKVKGMTGLVAGYVDYFTKQHYGNSDFMTGRNFLRDGFSKNYSRKDHFGIMTSLGISK